MIRDHEKYYSADQVLGANLGTLSSVSLHGICDRSSFYNATKMECFRLFGEISDCLNKKSRSH